jgi:hypothetical protein
LLSRKTTLRPTMLLPLLTPPTLLLRKILQLHLTLLLRMNRLLLLMHRPLTTRKLPMHLILQPAILHLATLLALSHRP